MATEIKKITSAEFTRLFKVKEFKGHFDCYGTWNGLDMYELDDTPENARIKMWNRLMFSGWAYTNREETLMAYASKSYWGKDNLEMQRVAKALAG